MFDMKVKVVGDEVGAELKLFVKQIDASIAAKAERLGQGMQKIIRNKLRSSTRRAKDTAPKKGKSMPLSESITYGVEPLGNGYRVWAGDEEFMDKNARHWRVIEHGSIHMVGKFIPGYFDPDTGDIKTDIFHHDRSEGRGMRIQRAIKGKHYFSRSINSCFDLAEKIFDKLIIAKE